MSEIVTKIDKNRKIEFLSKITVADYKALTYFNAFFKKRSFKYLLIVGAVASFAAITGNLTGMAKVNPWYFFTCIAFLALVLLQFAIIEQGIHKFLISDKFLINQERQIAIDFNSIHQEGGGENGTATYPIDKLYKAYETKKYFYLYISTLQAIIIPKRYLNDMEIDWLEKLLKTKLLKNFGKR